MHHHLIGTAVDLGHPRFTRVEQGDGLFYHRGRLGVPGGEVATPFPQLFDACPQISHAAPYPAPDRRSATNSRRTIGCTMAIRTKPAPPAP